MEFSEQMRTAFGGLDAVLMFGMIAIHTGNILYADILEFG